MHKKVFRQEEAKQGAEEEEDEEPGEDLRNLSAYNMRPNWAQSPNLSSLIIVHACSSESRPLH